MMEVQPIQQMLDSIGVEFDYNSIRGIRQPTYRYNAYDALVLKLINECKSLTIKVEEEKSQKTQSESRLRLLVSNFEKLVGNPNGDMIFDVNGTNLPAHTNIVSLWSVPFDLMLRSGMREGLTKRITLNEEPAVIQEMIRYFYTADANIDEETALPLLRLSSLYQIESLRDRCCTYLQKNMDAENCIPLFYFANLHRSDKTSKWKELYDTSLKYLRNNYASVLATPTPFKNLDLPLVVLILREITSREMVPLTHLATTKLLCSAIVNWATENWPVADLCELLTFINSEVARNKIQVFVKTSKNTLVILANETKKVYELKHVIEGKEAIPVAFQLLLFNGKVLRDDATLRDCGIQNDSTVQLCIRSNLYAGANTTPVATTTSWGGDVHVRGEEGQDRQSDLWKALYDFCLTAVVADFEEQSKCGGFIKLDVGTITHILQKDELGVSAEKVVLDALVTWLDARPGVKDDTHLLSRLLPLIRFPYIDTQTLLNVPNTHPVISSCPVFRVLLQEALHFQISDKIPATSPQRPATRSATSKKRTLHSSLEDTTLTTDTINNSRTKRRLLYKQTPTVNLDHFFSYVVSTVVQQQPQPDLQPEQNQNQNQNQHQSTTRKSF